MWPFKSKNLTQTIFSVGNYRLNDSIEGLENLNEFSNLEYQTYGREFVEEYNYNVSTVTFLGYSWKSILGTVNNRIYKIALFIESETKREANSIAMSVLNYCTGEYGKPSVQETGLFIWDAIDGNIVFQTAEIGDKLAINLFLTSNSVCNFERR